MSVWDLSPGLCYSLGFYLRSAIFLHGMKAQAKRRMGHDALPQLEPLLCATPDENTPHVHTENVDLKWGDAEGGG